MLPVKKETHLLRYFDLKGFEHTEEAPTKAHLEAKLEHLIKTDKATLMGHVFSKKEEWV
jgi:hypothetical protein